MVKRDNQRVDLMMNKKHDLMKRKFFDALRGFKCDRIRLQKSFISQVKSARARTF